MGQFSTIGTDYRVKYILESLNITNISNPYILSNMASSHRVQQSEKYPLTGLQSQSFSEVASIVFLLPSSSHYP